MADLVRAIDLDDIIMDFMSVSSYGDATETSGVIRIKKDLEMSPAGQNVLIVEDIIDSGTTLKYLRDEYFSGRNAKSVKTCAFLNKPSRRKADIEPDYCGFTVDDRFIIGYGLDYSEHFRQLSHITYLVEKK